MISKKKVLPHLYCLGLRLKYRSIEGQKGLTKEGSKEMTVKEEGNFSEREVEFLNCFAIHRYHEVISNMTEQDLEILNNPGWDQILEGHGNDWSTLYSKLMDFHGNAAKESTKKLGDFSLTIAHLVAEFTCNEEVHIGHELMEWICKEFQPFDGPKKPFGWSNHCSKELKKIIKDI